MSRLASREGRWCSSQLQGPEGMARPDGDASRARAHFTAAGSWEALAGPVGELSRAGFTAAGSREALAEPDGAPSEGGGALHSCRERGGIGYAGRRNDRRSWRRSRR